MPINGITAQEESQGQENPQEFSRTKFIEKSFITWRTFISWISEGQVTSAEETSQSRRSDSMIHMRGFLNYYFSTCQSVCRESSTEVWKA